MLQRISVLLCISACGNFAPISPDAGPSDANIFDAPSADADVEVVTTNIDQAIANMTGNGGLPDEPLARVDDNFT